MAVRETQEKEAKAAMKARAKELQRQRRQEGKGDKSRFSGMSVSSKPLLTVIEFIISIDLFKTNEIFPVDQENGNFKLMENEYKFHFCR